MYSVISVSERAFLPSYFILFSGACLSLQVPVDKTPGSWGGCLLRFWALDLLLIRSALWGQIMHRYFYMFICISVYPVHGTTLIFISRGNEIESSQFLWNSDDDVAFYPYHKNVWTEGDMGSTLVNISALHRNWTQEAFCLVTKFTFMDLTN
jgi:hypothetical protein